MAFGSIEIATITRTQDFTTIKHNEDGKGPLLQMNVGEKLQKETVQKTRQVNKQEETLWQNKRFDAREKGSNAYQGDGGRERRKKSEESIRQKGVSGGFDMKI